MEDISIFLAKFWGWYLLIFFFILSLNPRRIQQIYEDLKDQKFVLLASFLATVIGLINVLIHNIWEDNWTIIITFIGYLSLFFGLALFVFPERTVNWMSVINIKFMQVLYMLLFLTGIFLLNMAYGFVPI
ncbi:MAG: hypothetical protein QNJ57_11305 [Flavobacteriaceae bacterium]|nr:hypothetical protein [Flavobacteriaceae bacterium]